MHIQSNFLYGAPILYLPVKLFGQEMHLQELCVIIHCLKRFIPLIIVKSCMFGAEEIFAKYVFIFFIIYSLFIQYNIWRISSKV